MYWEGSFFSRQMTNDTNQLLAKIEDPAVLISNLDVENPDDLIPLLIIAQDAGFKSLLLVVRSLSERAMSLLLAKPNREKIHVVAVKAPGVGLDTQLAAAEDLAILTGGRPLLEQTGDLIKAVKLDDLGKARKAWADKDNFGISGGKGDKRKLRQHIASLRSALLHEEDTNSRSKMQERIGRLMGGSATLTIGGMTTKEVDFRKDLAERTAEAMRGAMQEGVVPGGGATLLACRPVIEHRMKISQHDDERMAFKILLHGLEEPTRVLLKNAGFNPDKVMPAIDAAGEGYAFNIRSGQIAKMGEVGIFDSAATVMSAVRAAINTAALGLTTDVLVHLKNPPTEYNT
jgi:chaperonin GroEL